MTVTPSAYRSFAITLLLAVFLLPASAHAIEVKKKLDMGGGGGGGGGGPAQSGPAPKNPLNPTQQKALFQQVTDDSDQFVAQESEKKSSGELYVDIEKATFNYVPKGGTVEAKLTAAEYKPKKSDQASKGTATGKKKALVFNYKVEGTKLTATEPPKWEDVDTGTDTAKKK